MVQGEFDFKIPRSPYYHSWVRKGNVVYDSAMKIATLESMYEQYFIAKYQYQQEELKELFKRTGSFTYYEEDLNSGVISPLAKLILYDTEDARQSAEKMMHNLDCYLTQKNYIFK